MDAYRQYPTVTTVDGVEYEIITDFRDWIKLIEMMHDNELEPAEKIYLMQKWYKDNVPETATGIMSGLLSFMNRNEKDEKKNKRKSRKKVVDFVLDADYITAGFLQAYGIDLQNIEYMHWYKFLSLFHALPSDTEIMQRIRYRSIDAGKIKDRAERARIRQIQLDIDLPQEELSDEEIGMAFMF